MDFQVASQRHLFLIGLTSVFQSYLSDLVLGSAILTHTECDYPANRQDVLNSRPVLPIDSLLIEAHTFHTQN